MTAALVHVAALALLGQIGVARRMLQETLDGDLDLEENGNCKDVNRAASKAMRSVQGIGRNTAWTVIRARTCPFTDHEDFKLRITANPLNMPYWHKYEELLHANKICIGCDSGKRSKIVDVNVASYERLTWVNGLGNGLAMRIIRARTCGFTDYDDIHARIHEVQGDHDYWRTIQWAFDKGHFCLLPGHRSADGTAAKKQKGSRNPKGSGSGGYYAGVATATEDSDRHGTHGSPGPRDPDGHRDAGKTQQLPVGTGPKKEQRTRGSGKLPGGTIPKKEQRTGDSENLPGGSVPKKEQEPTGPGAPVQEQPPCDCDREKAKGKNAATAGDAALQDLETLGPQEDPKESAAEFGTYDKFLPSSCRDLWRLCEVSLDIQGVARVTDNPAFSDCRTWAGNTPTIDDFECELLVKNIVKKAELSGERVTKGKKLEGQLRKDFRYQHLFND